MQKRDGYLIAALLILAVLAFVLFRSGGGESALTGDRVEITLGNAASPAYTASLDENRTFQIEQSDGRTNEVRIENGAVYMAHASCENQECVKQAEITRDNADTRALGEYIICLPNQVVVRLVRAEDPS